MGNGLRFEAGSQALANEIANAAGPTDLSVSAFKLPKLDNGTLPANRHGLARRRRNSVSRSAALLYARHARGGRIPDPASMLTTNFDRRPQWIEPKTVIEALAATHEPDAYLRGLEPQHPQFEKLRQLY